MRKYIFILTLMLLNVAVALAQTGISGTVVDDSGSPLIGATVMVDGTTTGTTTLADGTFQLPSNVSANAKLVVSYIGYLTAEVPVSGRTKVDVTLEAESMKLSEVVVVGYGSMERRDLTGAVGSVAAADIVSSGVANYDQALAGRIAGVQVSSSDGTPGEGLNIVIRGGNSITGDNSPLYVVDGVVFEDFDSSTLNASDIETLDVLKDASSTAIYGSRGANGVILITTKGGRSDGKTDVIVKASYGMSYVQKRLEVLSPYDYALYQQEVAYSKDNYKAADNVGSFVKKYGDPEWYRGVEGVSWQDEIMRTAPMMTGNVTFSGGNKTTQFYYSGEALNQEGGLINTGFAKLTNNLKVTHNINDKTKMTAQLMYNYYNRKGVTVSGNNYNSLIRDAVQYTPNNGIESLIYGSNYILDYDMYDPDDANTKYFFSPVKALENTQRRNRNNSMRGVLSLQRKIGKKFNLVVNGNYNRSLTKVDTFYEKDTQQGTRGNDGISASLTEQSNISMLGSAQLQYNYNKNGHKINTMVGTEANKSEYETTSYGAKLLPTDIFGLDKLQISSFPNQTSSDHTYTTMSSFFGRLNYTLKDKYLFTVNFRADGSSKFAKENRWGYFPSASAAWRMSSEDFIKDIDWISNMKLRAGWGLTGNNRVGSYASRTYMNVNGNSTYAWGDTEQPVAGVYIANLGVPDLTWETTAQTSAGLDMGFLKNRITVTVDWYKKVTSDLLLNADMALSTGFTTVQQNVGKVQNQGWEFTLNTVNIVKPKFEWYSSFNISTNENKILALNSGQDILYTNANFLGCNQEYSYVSIVGESVGDFYGLKRDGVYQWSDFYFNAEDGTYSLKEGIPDNGKAPAPGSAKFIDQNGDGTINEEDRIVLGSADPDFFGGLTNDFVFLKNFDAQIFLQWSYGNQILNGNRLNMGTTGGNTTNKIDNVATTMWKPYSTSTNMNAARYQTIFGSPSGDQQVTDYMIDDASYLKLKTVSIGYSIPRAKLESLKIKKLRVYASAQNLYTWTNYTGYDPDVSVGRYGALTQGLDVSAYPQSTTILGGVEVIF